jgi:hypothetical protein
MYFSTIIFTDWRPGEALLQYTIQYKDKQLAIAKMKQHLLQIQLNPNMLVVARNKAGCWLKKPMFNQDILPTNKSKKTQAHRSSLPANDSPDEAVKSAPVTQLINNVGFF